MFNKVSNQNSTPAAKYLTQEIKGINLNVSEIPVTTGTPTPAVTPSNSLNLGQAHGKK